MKRWIKIFLCTALILFIVGGLMMVGAWASVGFDVRRLSVGINNNEPIVSYENVSFAAKDVNVIEVQLETADVVVKPSKNDEIHMQWANGNTLHTEADLLDGVLRVNNEYTQTDGTYNGLIINFDIFHWDFDDDDDDYGDYGETLYIQIPDSYTGELVVGSRSGDVEITNVQLQENLVVYAEVGDVELHGLEAVDGNITTEMGDIQLERTDFSGDLTAYSQVGDVELELTTIEGTLSAKTELGDISLERVDTHVAMLELEFGELELEKLDAIDTNIIAQGNIEGTFVGAKGAYTILIDSQLGKSNTRDQVGNGERMLEITQEYGDIKIFFRK